MDTTGPERFTLANTIWEFVHNLCLPAINPGADKFLFLSSLIARTDRLSMLSLKLPHSTRNIIPFRGTRNAELNRSGYGL